MHFVFSKNSIQLTVLTAIRAFVAPLVSTMALVVAASVLDVRFTRFYVTLAFVSALLSWIAIGSDRRERPPLQASPWASAGQTLLEWLAIVGTLLLVGYATKSSDAFSRRVLLVWFAVTPVVMIATFALVDVWTCRVVGATRNARRAVIVGENEMSAELAKTIRGRPDLGIMLDRVFHALEGPRARGSRRHAAATRSRAIHDYVNRCHIDVVFVALAPDDDEARALIDDLKDTTASVYVVPGIAVRDLIQARSDQIAGVPVIALCESPFRGPNGLVKRATDVAFTLVLILCASPVLLAIAVAVKLTSRGRVLFKQYRYGLDGERITVYKFRTMTVTENGHRIQQATRDDPRVTPVGRLLRKTSLDELPQLLNVLSGSMSLVGPRPHAVAHNEQYRKLIRGYMIRHKVAPGITGLAQVNGCRGETHTIDDMRRRVQYDLEYLRNWCWLLDLKILLKTVALVIRDKRAY